jgi:hypothetical protein
MHDEQKTQPKKDNEVMISYASEDKAFAGQLTIELQRRGFNPWRDEISLVWGQSNRREIDKAINDSWKVIVIASNHYFSKKWTVYEFDGIVQRHVAENGLILPIWHGVAEPEVRTFSAHLANLHAMKSSDGVSKICDEFEKVLSLTPTQPQSTVIPPNPESKIPRLVRDGGPEAKVFHIWPQHVEVGEVDPHINFPKYFAPYPDRITGLRPQHIEEASAKRQVIRLRDNIPRNPLDGEYQSFHYTGSVPPHPADEHFF